MGKQDNYSIKLLHRLYSLADEKPNSIAVVDRCGSRQTNYKDFIATINSYAYYFKKQGVNTGDVVSICLDGCMEHYAVRFACAFIGAVFISINPNYPAKRVETIHEHANVEYVIDKDTLKNTPIKDYSCQIDDTLDDTNLCYIISTSGTTSKPKLVLHDRSYFKLLHVLDGTFIVKSYHINHAAMSDMMFVMSLIDMLLLFSANTIHIIDNSIKTDIVKLKEYFQVHHINWTFILPSLLAALSPLSNLKVAIVGGEVTNVDLSKIDADIYNYYGASEACGISYAKVIDKTSALESTLSSSKFYLEDEKGRAIPKSSPNKKGEVCICAPWVMRGYIDDKDATDEVISFREGDRYKTYHTKDIGYYNEKGQLILCGRADSTQKIRGKRVDLAGLEYQMSRIEGVSECVVITKQTSQEKTLYVFYTTSDKSELDKDYLKEELSKLVPEYMIPNSFIFVDVLKRNARGKIDKQYLEGLTGKAHHTQASFTDTQQRISKLIEEILEIERVSLDENLQSIGFSSLSFMRFQSKLSETFDIHISRDALIELANIKYIADAIDKGKFKKEDDSKNPYTNPIPLNEAQLNVYLDETTNDLDTAYNNPIKIDVTGFSRQDIKKAFATLANIHPILCSRVQVIDSVPSLVFDADISIDTIKNEKDFVQTFDLERALCKVNFYQNNNKLYLLADFHHIICDGTSISLLINEFVAILQNEAIPIRLDSGVARYYTYEQGIKDTDKYRDAINFFDSLLCEADDIEELVESVGNNVQSTLSFDIDIDAKIIDSFCTKLHISKTQYLTSTFGYVLSRFTGSDKSCLCLVEDGRSHIDLSDSVGMYVKTLPLVFDCANKNINDYLSDCAKIISQAQSYDFYPFRVLANKYNISSSIQFQYSHALRDVNKGFYFEELDHALVGDLSVNVSDTNTGFHLTIEHSGKYSDALCKSIAYSFAETVKGMLAKDKLSDITYTSM